MAYIIGGLIAIPIIAVCLFVASLIQGYCLHIMWGWFIVPLGAPGISIPSAIGITLVCGMLTHQHQYKPKEQDPGDKWTPVYREFLGPFLVLGIGWVTKLFL